MKLKLFMVLAFALLLTGFSCQAQNGPTAPSITVSWIQSTGSTNALAKNCVYRGVAAGTYDLPAKFCSSTPITSWKDVAVVRGTTYHYAVTAQDVNGAESAYSADLQATSPIINAPAGLATVIISTLFPPHLSPRQTKRTLLAGIR